ncbi:MAG: tRNA uridine-5-carboxymethylaminomethyl(34) synthesis GTPase MnmE [Pseudomonadota bacterium]|uniref:tRNA modification GTPase MnmE n=1 Tax=Candidatus Desulfatibia profunda TaxID=2841695 RepID=A0A8J6TP28_9BACT|nr:tRNA uridine-5-carboxymethylaminomethyl(34) synthesis GTPase MnmE [Candidatus Desulfatibia profunda]MBL7179995.1 tRNA uridine-5-carboxymethylaminomethyl(34) synthesis GTPase MnmE [Desulfobacterales bacterium]
MGTDTIAAIATPIGRGGIGIIKISGSDAVSIAKSVFQRSADSSDRSQAADAPLFSALQSHRLYHGHILDLENGKVLDEVLLAVMLAPHTYTREDVVEINSHSGPVVLASILELVLKKGARLAAPGEFTKRAYLNGRIDLTQAEAVVDIINSRTGKSLEIAASQIKGDLKRKVESIRDVLLDILAGTEAAIDFPDDAEDVVNIKTVGIITDKVVAPLKELVQHHENAHVLRDGIKMAVVGKPNVGKSSLMNRLIQSDRAIVTPIPGTTRDLIEETLNIRGIPVIVADTAGLHETEDPVEVIGIQKTREYIRSADLILFMVDASEPLTNEDYRIYETIQDKQVILVVNKTDLVAEDFELECPGSWRQTASTKISALYGQGFSEIKDLIAKVFLGEYQIEAGSKIVPNLRHKIALERGLQLAVSAVEEINKQTPFELIAIDIREAIDALGEIIGLTTREDVIDQIFNRFCIGK